MNRVIVRSKVDADGVLRVAVPVGADAADREVQVTIEPLAAPRMTQDEWQEFIRSTAGSIADPTFVRHPQGSHAP
ncbi:MAG TPA: hypothetical protein VGY55_01985 [Pirellulales bacterium]|jgi:hypothetical protein|nr:hypothetical protein [Pirellulales bacterium]